MDIRQLRSFLAVAEEFNFGRASERINLSQPALSRQIKALEDELGFTLFDRSTKTTRLTAAGKVYENAARKFLAELDGSAKAARDIAQGKGGHLRIGIFGSAILDFIPEVIRRFSKESPNVHVSLHLMDKDQQLDALRRGQLDLGFNRLVPQEPDIVVERVRSEPLLFATHHDNPLSGRDDVSLEVILREPLILYPSGVRNSLVNQIHDMFLKSGATPNVTHEVPDAITALALVSGGLGSSIMPRAVSHIRPPNVVFLPFIAEGARINLACLYARSNRMPALAAMLAIIRTVAREQEQ